MLRTRAHGVASAWGLVAVLAGVGCSADGAGTSDMSGPNDGASSPGGEAPGEVGVDGESDAGAAAPIEQQVNPVESSDPPPTGTPILPEVTDYAAPGPFETIQEPGGSECTIFRPAVLGDEGLSHPIIVWGNGTFASPAIYSAVLEHWASHGFVVAAANTSNAGTGVEMVGCLDWVIDEYGADVDAARVGTSGHSQGGGGSLMAGRDPRVVATVPLQPYVQGLGHDMASLSAQNGPMLLFSGTADTIAAPAQNQQPVFDQTNVATIWANLVGADHISSAIGDITGYRGPATAWFRLHLAGDARARDMFHGAECALCTSADWEIQKKNMD